MEVLGSPVRLPSGNQLPLSSGRVAGDFVFLSGQIGARDGKIVQGGIAAQTAAALDNIEYLLREAGLTLRDIVKSTVWLTNLEDFAVFNASYGERVQEPYPARSTVVSQLLLPGAVVEIEVIACVNERNRN
jgi:2-iminobutanoate/2-iminopropanoate deaminase